MSITGIIVGAIMLVTNPADGMKKIYHGVQVLSQIEQKSANKEWKASAHEESYQIVKDTIKNIKN